MYSFSDLEPVCFFMSSSNCCFLTCTQVSQEASQVVWYSHLLNFPQFVVIHTVKGFGIISKAEVDIFLKLCCIFNDPMCWEPTPETLPLKRPEGRKPDWQGEQVFRGFEKVSSRDPNLNKAIREKTWWTRRIRFSGVFEKASSRDPTHDEVTRRKPDRQGRSGFQGFQKAAPGSHLKDDVCLSDACLNGLLPNFSDTDRKALPDLFPNKNQFRTLINKLPRWWYFMRLFRVKGVFWFKLLCW